MSNKIKIAVVKWAGLATGGTETFLQTIAANLPKDQFEVDYFYTNAAPYIGSDWKHPENTKERLQYMRDHGIEPIKVNVKYKDITVPTHDWIDTNFWGLFDESKYDIIQTGRAGHPEYPFIKITKTPIVDSLHLVGMVDYQENIAKVVHISKFAIDQWIKHGGSAAKVELVGSPIEINKDAIKNINKNLKKELGLEGKFIYGMHQRDNDGIFSSMPLEAYKQIETNDTAYVVLGGSKNYKKQARSLKLKNFVQLDYSSDLTRIYSFLNMLDTYAHGRKDGENNSRAMAEAMFFGLPIISHFSQQSNGHVEAIEGVGTVVNNQDEYAKALLFINNNKDKRQEWSQAAKEKFKTNYSLENQIKHFVKIYKEVYNQTRINNLPADDFWNEIN